MKPQAHIFTLLLPALAACSGNPDPAEPPMPEGTPISYAVAVDSRAQQLHGSAADVSHFFVRAMESATAAPFIDCDKMVRTESGAYAQTDGHNRYWPQQGTQLSFFAIAGIDSAPAMEWTAEGAKLADFTVDSRVEAQRDLLVAVTGPVATPGNEAAAAPVTLAFSHALAQIALMVRNENPALDLEITGIGLQGVAPSGALSLSAATVDGFSWTPVGSTADFRKEFAQAVTIHSGSESALPGGDEALQSIMLMIPQTLQPFNKDSRPRGASILLRANVWNVAAGTGVHSATDKKIWGEGTTVGEWMVIPLDDQWQAGRRHVYTLTFTASGTMPAFEDKDDPDKVFDMIDFKASVQPWVGSGDFVQNIY